MAGYRSRLDRFLSQQLGISRRAVRPLLAAGRVTVDGEVVGDRQRLVDAFSLVSLDDQVLQQRRRRYLMLNKPAGVVSATRDDRHTTVLDLLADTRSADLHLAGRLDYHSTGLVLITNDGQWSRALSHPDCGVAKRYRVVLEKPLGQADVDAFAAGMFFAYEGITTRPAGLQLLAEREAQVTLQEGRYHQIRRMFARQGNRVLALHRLAIGNLVLDPALAPGQCRELSPSEVNGIMEGH
ncbi:MAG: 16S rRNA pseudouridine(516) synthase [Alcanivorax sp.]|nr:16S rRNA pseudouridine(516) synthase [Alcanivorax sp.]